MAWPLTPGFGTTNVDAGTDSPASARSDIKDLMDDVTDMITARGAANGIASLDSGGKVPVGQLPSSSVGGLLGYRAWVTPGNFTFDVPTGVTKMKATVVAGGGGGSTGGGSGKGGGAGGHVVGVLAVTAGQTLLVNVGAGGNGGIDVGTPNGTAGGDSGVQVPAGNYLTAYGGQGGTQSTGGTGGSVAHSVANPPFYRVGENGGASGGLTDFSPKSAPARNGHGGAGGDPGAVGNAGQSGFIILEW